MNRFIASIQRDSPLFPLPSPRRGFTLVELLATIVIIGILAGMSLAALSTVQRAAKADATRATIAKINAIIMDKYESYQHRRLPFKPVSPGVFADVPQVSGVYLTASEVAGRRLDALRDLMRMELPDRWNDISDPPISFAWTQPPSGSAHQWTTAPAITQRWQARYTAAQNALIAKGKSASEADEILARYASAKLLYMIVMEDVENADLFRSDEIARLTEDGLPVFIDAWGNPIKFLRWAPGFDQSDIQPVPSPIDNAAARVAASVLGKNLDPADPKPVRNRDPLNPKQVYRHGGLTAPFTTENGTPTGGANVIPVGWELYPLIYSAGPDGIYDITVGGTSYHYTGDPFQVFSGPPAFSIGSPTDSDNTSETAGISVPANGSVDHYDNITNHRIEVR